VISVVFAKGLTIFTMYNLGSQAGTGIEVPALTCCTETLRSWVKYFVLLNTCLNMLEVYLSSMPDMSTRLACECNTNNISKYYTYYYNKIILAKQQIPEKLYPA